MAQNCSGWNDSRYPDLYISLPVRRGLRSPGRRAERQWRKHHQSKHIPRLHATQLVISFVAVADIVL